MRGRSVLVGLWYYGRSSLAELLRERLRIRRRIAKGGCGEAELLPEKLSRLWSQQEVPTGKEEPRDWGWERGHVGNSRCGGGALEKVVMGGGIAELEFGGEGTVRCSLILDPS